MTRRKQTWGIAAAVGALQFMLMSVPCLAAQQNNGTIAQGFQVDTSRGAIVSGALVCTKAGNSRTVQLAATDTAGLLVGIVDQNPLLAISGGSKEAQVVLSGTTNVLVSDINGAVHAKDKITASPIAGVGMLATADGQVVGTAQTSFDTATAQTRSVADSRGRTHTVHVGFVPLQVSVADYRAPGSSFLPPFVVSFANGIAGRSVSLIRISLSSVLLLLGLVSAVALVYSSVRSGMISLGRNPLAANNIRKSLYQMGLVVIALVGGTLLASYLILTV